ncbi:MAG: transglycosylase domain-containing protein, partial [Pseudomonadota bacterium]
TFFFDLSWSTPLLLVFFLIFAFLGPGISGAGPATRHFFDRAPSDVSIEQAALLAAVLPNPKRLRADRRTDYLAERQSWIVTQMARLRREQWITLVR